MLFDFYGYSFFKERQDNDVNIFLEQLCSGIKEVLSYLYVTRYSIQRK